jgi:hypothetical protein
MTARFMTFQFGGASFGADWLGKFKMGLQCAALIAIANEEPSSNNHRKCQDYQ